MRTELQFSGMSLARLAELSGIKKQTLASYLGSRAKIPSAEAAVRIARALNVSVEYLVTGRESQPKYNPAPLVPEAQRVLRIMGDMDEADRKIVLSLILQLKEREIKRHGG